MKSNTFFIKCCYHPHNGKEWELYPDWVIKDESDSSDSESDSEYQNLFKMIQRNEYSTNTDVSKESDNSGSLQGDMFEKEKGSDSHDINKDEKVKSKKTLTRPTLFMRPISKGEATSDVKAPHRKSKFSAGVGKDQIMAMKLLIMQKGLSETVEPEYRKKDRILLSVRCSDFNICHQSRVKKITDRLKDVLHKDYCYINDRDAAESLEVKIQKILETKVTKEKKEMEIQWKSKEPFPEFYQVMEKYPKSLREIPLENQLDYNMPHRKFEKDINKYVKRLRELSDHFHRKTSGPFVKFEPAFERKESIKEIVENEITNYRLIPTIQTYKKDHLQKETSNSNISEFSGSMPSELVVEPIENKQSKTSPIKSLIHQELVDHKQINLVRLSSRDVFRTYCWLIR